MDLQPDSSRVLQYYVSVDEIRSCGTRCREVTLILENTGNVTAHELGGRVLIQTGGTVIWHGDEAIGELSPGETYQTTHEVFISYEDAAQVIRNELKISLLLLLDAKEGMVVIENAYDLRSGKQINPIVPRITDGTETEVSVDGTTYYLINEIPSEPPDRDAVTTTDYQLVSPERARAVIATDFWRQQRYELDWDSILKRTNDARERSLDWYRAGNYLDVGWDITEALLYTSAGIPPVGPVLDGLTDVANTIGEITETPWKESFIKITASLDTVKNVKEITREVEWYEDIDDDLLQDLIDIGLNYESLVSTTDDLTKAWQLLFKGIKSGGMSRSVFLSASAQKALMTAKSVFIGLAISATVDTVESAVKLATDAHGLTHAWTTARIPILRELKQVDNRMRDRDHTMGDGHYHYWLVIQDYQMKTLAFEGSRRYWQAIADSTLGAVWNFFGNAQSRAEKYGRWAEDANEMAKLMLNIYGSTESTIRSRANTSVNATFASRPSRQIVGPNRRGLTE